MTNATKPMVISARRMAKRDAGSGCKVEMFMRTFGWMLLVATLALGAGVPAAAQDRATNCRPMAERGRVWVECCNQSFTRHPARAMSRRARLQGIERCVRNRLRHP